MIGWRHAMGSPREYYLLCPYTFTLVERVRGQRTLSSKATKGRRLTNMKVFFTLAALLAISFAQDPNHTPPKVQVYSHNPGEFDKENTLICHVSGFHPPDITIQLMKDGVELPNAKQTDLAFKQGWRFVLTKHVTFTPGHGEKYTCKVTHGTTVRDYAWESNM